MAPKTKPKRGRPTNGTTQRSIRLPDDAWQAFSKLVEQMNAERDPIDNPLDVTKLINMAMRDYLAKNGRSDVYPQAPSKTRRVAA